MSKYTTEAKTKWKQCPNWLFFNNYLLLNFDIEQLLLFFFE